MRTKLRKGGYLPPHKRVEWMASEDPSDTGDFVVIFKYNVKKKILGSFSGNHFESKHLMKYYFLQHMTILILKLCFYISLTCLGLSKGSSYFADRIFCLRLAYCYTGIIPNDKIIHQRVLFLLVKANLLIFSCTQQVLSNYLVN